MCNSVLLISLIYFCLLSTLHGLKDQYFPRRLDKVVNQTDSFDVDTNPDFDRSRGQGSEFDLRPVSDLNEPKSTECGIICYILLNDRDLVDCRSTQVWKTDRALPSVQPIHCEHHVDTGELILGRKESIRSLVAGSLRTLLLPGSRDLTRTGQLFLQLNLNMVYLDAGIFRGMSGLITDVRILNTVFMHPDSLIDLQRLRFFEITSGKAPKIIRNESALDSNFKSTSNQIANRNGLFYLRLKPVDMTAPITFNLNVECHQCPKLNISYENMIIVKLHQPSGRLNMIYPNSCPVRQNAIGCPTNSSLDDPPIEELPNLDNLDNNPHSPDFSIQAPNESHPLKQVDPELSVHSVSSSQPTQSLTIALSIWCTILTIIFIVIIILIFLCSRRHFDPKHQFSIPFFNRFTQRPFSVEETSSDSASFGFYPTNSQHHHQQQQHLPPHLQQQPHHESSKSIQPEPNDLLINHLMAGSQTSFSTLNMPNGRSTSVHSLRDKSMRSSHFYGQCGNMNSLYRSRRRSKQGEIRNRSIGSQTDFTDLDSDLNTYSTLSQSTERYKSVRVHDAPRRTTSHQFLPYSTKNPDRWDGVVFHQAHYVPKRERNSYTGSETNPDLLILMIDGQATSHPPIRSLPPTHPVSKSILGSHMGGLNSTMYSTSSRPAVNV